jgi:amino acid adenylation domain-containing protein
MTWNLCSAPKDRDASAIVCNAGILTYRDLHARAEELAGRLARLGVSPGSLVALCLERSPEFVCAALAAFKAGAAYLPLDPAYPSGRLGFMLEDAGAAAVVGRGAFPDRLPRGAAAVLDLDRPADAAAAAPCCEPPEIRPEDLAYVIYTSGSTGQPKGVEVTHANLANLVEWHVTTFGVSAADRATLVSSPGFDAAVWELWPYLAAGAALYLPDEEARLSPEKMRDYLVANRITIAFLPTPLAERVMALDWPGDTALRYLLTGGDRLLRHPPAGLPFAVVNNYGPTECTVVATSGILSAGSGQVPPPIGRAIGNVEIRILDESLQPVPSGAAGEICIGGAGVARGYRKRACMNGESFIPDPFAKAPGARLYRTGDLGCYLPDGQIAFLGRRDEQLKIRGFRIEPGEIAAALNRHPAVGSAVVVARESPAGEKRLLAYLCRTGSATPSVSHLRDFLRETLPDYMIPSGFVFLDAFPLTPNGKVDRAALPEPENSPPALRPRTPVEERVSAILEDLLGGIEIGVSDNFFQMGGHSLLGAQVIARVRDLFGVEMPLRTLFDCPTVAEISAEIERAVAARVEAMSDEEAERLLLSFGENA